MEDNIENIEGEEEKKKDSMSKLSACDLNPYERCRIYLSEFNNNMYVHVRTFSKDRSGYNIVPTKKGIAMQLKYWKEFVKAVEKATPLIEETLNKDKLKEV